ncbi:MAG: glycosyltransferase [Candidatus Limnocylindrales bacterium]
MPRYGWRAIVVAPAGARSEPVDQAALALIPASARVVRTRYLELHNLRPLVRIVRAMLGGWLDRPPLQTAANANLAANSPDETSTITLGAPGGRRRTEVVRGRATTRIAWVRRRLMFPDNQLGWLPFAVMAGMRACWTWAPEAIYSTGPPVTAHVAAGIISRLMGLPWIAEFRDPWLGNALEQPHPWIERRLRTKVERWIVRSAARIVCVTPTLTNLYRQRYPGAAVETITNGYDRSEALPRFDRRADEPFRLVYAGTIDRPRELQTFLDGLSELVRRHPDVRDRLRVTFFGRVSEPCGVIAASFAEASLGGILRMEGFVPRSIAVRALSEADSALVLLGDGPGMNLFVPGKLYDCIGLSRQLFAMLPQGDARDLLHELGWGILADPDPVSVERGLERLLEAAAPERVADPERRFDRELLTMRIAAALTAVADEQAERRV